MMWFEGEEGEVGILGSGEGDRGWVGMDDGGLAGCVSSSKPSRNPAKGI